MARTMPAPSDHEDPSEVVGRFTPPKVDAALWLSLRGRVPRSTYWLYFVVPISAIALLAAALDAATGAVPTNLIAVAIRSNFGETYLSVSALAGPASNVAFLAYFWPATVGTVKRLHDLGVSGWLYAAYFVVSYGSWGFFLMSSRSGAAVSLVVLASLVGVVFSVFVFFMPGTPGQSQYGPDPLGRSDSVGS